MVSDTPLVLLVMCALVGSSLPAGAVVPAAIVQEVDNENLASSIVSNVLVISL
ncbi:MAG: hypothetical protein M3298_05355 [Thermoproteota archaeon]|nr:hypothetical protein [Thermoproteota archaeon]